MVETILATPEDVTEWFTGYGSAGPDRTVQLAAEVSGTLIERVNDVEAGSTVSKGQPLIRLDDREYRHTLERVSALADADQAGIEELEAEARTLQKIVTTAEQELRVAADERKRVADLFERNLAAKKEFDFAHLAYQQARRVLQGYEMQSARIGPRRSRLEASKQAREAEARLAALNMERCEIAAPFSGTIEVLFVDAGDHVAPGAPLMTLIDPSRVEIPVQLPGAVFEHVALGAPCRLSCESMPESSWQGQVVRISPSIDELTRTFSAYLEVDNSKQLQPLVPGTFVTARLRGPMYSKRLLVPRGAVRGGYILVAREGTANKQAVTVERVIGDRAMLSGDIAEGQRVIISQLGQFEDGAPVRISTDAPESRRLEVLSTETGIGIGP